jgi:hypothetical protein
MHVGTANSAVRLRAEAEECRFLASKISLDRDRQVMLAMAASYIARAEMAERAEVGPMLYASRRAHDSLTPPAVISVHPLQTAGTA